MKRMSIIPTVYAHEAYVLTPEQFHQGLLINTPNPLSGLLDPSHFVLTVFITIAVILSYILVIFWSTTKPAEILDKFVRKLRVIGPILIRLAVSSSLIIGSLSGDIFGPELPISKFPHGMLMQGLLLLAGFMILLGIFTETAALIALLGFIYAIYHYGWYMVTYSNYLGEFIVLALFGSRFLSVDNTIFGRITLLKALEKYRSLETPIVRILYGLALIYAGYTIKFLHQNLSVLVYNEYHLQNFFHSTATFIASGAGVSEVLIGLFIILGFAQRFTIAISLVFITLSLLYFRELVWPHFMLYGISLNLIINSADNFTLDHLMIPWLRRLLHKSDK